MQGNDTALEKGNTKYEILDAALELFSTNGYEATSMLMIADAVGIRKASLYSHFAGKEEILDTIMKNILEEYEKHSIFANADWSNPRFTADKQDITADVAAKMIIGHIKYIIHDPKVSKVRRMLTIEQFRNREMALLQTKHNYTDVMRYFTGLVQFLISKGKLSDHDPKVMAAQLCLPISVWINYCDREPEKESLITELIERHVMHFFDMYGTSDET